MGRQRRTTVSMSFSTNEKMWYKNSKEADPDEANFIMQKENNTVMIHTGNRNIFANADQRRNRFEDVCVEESEVDDDLKGIDWKNIWRKM